jgi:aminoglycoside phosphotransferase (APT) family kinase protein
MSDVIVAPQVRDLDELSTVLARWLAEHLPEARDLKVTNLDYPRGAGQSHETILFDAQWQENGESQHRGMVVRIKPSRFTVYPDDLFTEQYRIMQVMHESGRVKVARPLWIEQDASVLGAPFFIMEKVAGRVPVSIPPYSQTGWVAEASAEQRRRMWENGVRQLAAIQSLPLEDARFLEGPPHAREGLEQEFDKYVRAAAWVQEDRRLPVLDAALARLRERWPENRPAGLVWGDARIGNMIFDDQFDVVAVVDWEQPSLGGALNDLAWWVVNAELMHGANETRPHLAGMGTKEETIALWEELTGISAEGLEWYEDFTRLKMSCLGVRMASLRGAPPPDERELAVRLKVA